MDPANWGGTAPVAGDALTFPSGAANLTNTNDFPAGTTRTTAYVVTGSLASVQSEMAALANDGVLMRPQLVREIRSPDGSSQVIVPQPVRTVVSRPPTCSARC